MTNFTRLVVLVSLALVGCDRFGAFEVPIALSEQRVEGSPLGGIFGGLFEVPIPLEVDVEAETEARDTGPARHVRLVALVLEVSPTGVASGDRDDFGFVDSAEIFVQSAQDGPALPRRRIAHLPTVADGADVVVFETDDSVDLLPYIESGARLTSEARGTAPPDDVTFTGGITLSVELF